MNYFTPDQIAELLQVSSDKTYQLIRSGRLGHYRIGRQYRISEKHLNKFLESTETSRR